MDLGEALSLLRGGQEGIAKWNRRNNRLSEIVYLHGVDLSHADLRYADLSNVELVKADLSNAILVGAKLNNAFLHNANLSDANLSGADLYWADLSFANLWRADLNWSDFSGSDLTSANLAASNLSGAILRGVELRGAVFKGAICHSTVFARVDLSDVVGLDLVEHKGPSTIGIETLFLSNGRIPESFLRGCGVPGILIDYLPSLIGAPLPVKFYSYFISCSLADMAFADRLSKTLQEAGVRTWQVPHELKLSGSMYRSINRVIKSECKIILVLSKSSLSSAWIRDEARSASRIEVETKRAVLIPVCLDDSILELQNDPDLRPLLDRQVADFREWTNESEFRRSFARLMRDLTVTASVESEA